MSSPMPTLLLRPEQPILSTPVTIRAQEEARTLTVRLPDYHERFRLTMRDLCYTWDGSARVWERILPPTAGAVAHRLAELADALVDAGFAVRFAETGETLDNSDLAQHAYQLALSGDWEPEHWRWVKALLGGGYAGWLQLWWERHRAPGVDLYTAARRIRGSRYAARHVIVPVGSADEVEDFAAAYDFRFTEKAQALIDAAREELAHGVVLATPRGKRRRQAQQQQPAVPIVPLATGDRPPVLPIPPVVEIAEELRDALRDDD